MKQEYDKPQAEELYEIFISNEQEPVAWMREDGTLKFKAGEYFLVGQPFYTTPQLKELSDEEIFEELRAKGKNVAIKYYGGSPIFDNCTGVEFTDKDSFIAFINLILKKASEK